jgi:hypothetical protein
VDFGEGLEKFIQAETTGLEGGRLTHNWAGIKGFLYKYVSFYFLSI